MTTSKLSEHEVAAIGVLAIAQDIPGLIQYLNRILHYRNLGTDTCARPFSIRSKKDMEEPCFAKGYLSKVLEFIGESKKRLEDKTTLERTENYLTNLVTEIDGFFCKKKEGIHGKS